MRLKKTIEKKYITEEYLKPSYFFHQSQKDYDRLKNQNLFDYDSVKILINEHFSHKKNNANKIWALLIFQKWFGNL